MEGHDDQGGTPTSSSALGAEVQGKVWVAMYDDFHTTVLYKNYGTS